MQDRFSQLNPETLYSIFNHRMRGRCAVAGKKLQDETIVQSLINEYQNRIRENKKNGRRKAVIPAISTERGMFPWMVFRAILIKHIELKNGHPPSKKLIQSFIRSPHLIKVCDKKIFKIDGYSGIVR